MDRDLIYALIILWIIMLYAGISSYIKGKSKITEMGSRCTRRTMGTISYLSKGLCFDGIGNINTRGLVKEYGLKYSVLRYMVYEFSVEGDTFSGIDARVPFSIFSAGKPGEEVELYYNENKPEEFISHKEDVNVRYGGMISAAFIAACITIFICVTSVWG